MRAELSKLHDQLNNTIINVTHDQVEVITMVTKIVIMNEGVPNQVGTPMEIHGYPINKYLGVIGNSCMNFMPARNVADDSKLFDDSGIFRLLIPPAKTIVSPEQNGSGDDHRVKLHSSGGVLIRVTAEGDGHEIHEKTRNIIFYFRVISWVSCPTILIKKSFCSDQTGCFLAGGCAHMLLRPLFEA